MRKEMEQNPDSKALTWISADRDVGSVAYLKLSSVD